MTRVYHTVMRRNFRFQIVAPPALLLLAGAAGCSWGPASGVTLMTTHARRVVEDGRLIAIGFTSSFQAAGSEQRQLVYRVEIQDARGRPIASRDGRYENASGHVAVGRTIMLLRRDSSLQEVMVRIPVEELEVRSADEPIWATVGLYRPDDICLASHFVQLPLDRRDNEVLAPNRRRAGSLSSAPATAPRQVLRAVLGHGLPVLSRSFGAVQWMAVSTVADLVVPQTGALRGGAPLSSTNTPARIDQR